MTITRLEVIPGLGVAEAVAELDCDYGTFMLMGDELYILDDQEDDWEPVDMDIVAEDPEQEQEDGDEVEDFLNKPHVKAAIGVGAAATLCGESFLMSLDCCCAYN